MSLVGERATKIGGLIETNAEVYLETMRLKFAVTSFDNQPYVEAVGMRVLLRYP